LRKAGLIALGVVAVAAAIFVAMRLMVTDRDRVARVIRRLAREVERRDAGSFCLLLTDDYTDSSGHDRAALRERLTVGLPQLQSVSVRLDELKIEVREDTAKADFVANVVARTRFDDRDWRWPSQVRLRLRKQNGEWRVYEAEYHIPVHSEF
jgi:hypothetical protein